MEYTKLDIANKVTQSNDLITAQYKLSLNEQKIILCLISLIQPSDTDFKKYNFRVKDLINILDTKSKWFYNELQEATGNLLKKTLSIKSKDRLLQINWLSSAEYFHDKWCIELSFDPKLKPYLLNLKNNFLSYDFWVTVKFRSTYTIRFFQLLLSYHRKYNKKEFTFSLDSIKSMLQISNNQYEKFSNFKSRILEPARKELEEKHKNFYFKYKEIKAARKIVSIEFSVIVQEPTTEKPVVITNSISNELSKWIPSETIIAWYIEKFWIAIIEQNFEYFKSQLEKWKIKDKDNPTSFLIKAIENNYAWNLPSKDLLKSKQEIEKEKEVRRQEEERRATERKKKFELHLKELFKIKYTALPDDKKKVLEYDFIQHLKESNHGQSIFNKIKKNWFTDSFLEFYLFNKKKLLTESEVNFELWDRTQTLF